MNYMEMLEAVDSAENTIKEADRAVERLLPLLVGRLHKIRGFRGVDAIVELKRELKNFNSVTREWK